MYWLKATCLAWGSTVAKIPFESFALRIVVVTGAYISWSCLSINALSTQGGKQPSD